MNAIEDKVFVAELNAAVEQYQINVRERAATESPYGVPYTPNIWGAGWTIQEFGVHQYFFAKSWPSVHNQRCLFERPEFCVGRTPRQ